MKKQIGFAIKDGIVDGLNQAIDGTKKLISGKKQQVEGCLCLNHIP